MAIYYVHSSFNPLTPDRTHTKRTLVRAGTFMIMTARDRHWAASAVNCITD